MQWPLSTPGPGLRYSLAVFVFKSPSKCYFSGPLHSPCLPQILSTLWTLRHLQLSGGARRMRRREGGTALKTNTSFSQSEQNT